MTERPDMKPARWTLWLRRGPWETGAMSVIALGILMLTQPFSLDLYTYSFVTILGGTLGFVLASHFPQ
jgi:hypothetical protein